MMAGSELALGRIDSFESPPFHNVDEKVLSQVLRVVPRPAPPSDIGVHWEPISLAQKTRGVLVGLFIARPENDAPMCCGEGRAREPNGRLVRDLVAHMKLTYYSTRSRISSDFGAAISINDIGQPLKRSV